MWYWNWFLDTWLDQRSRWTTSFERICACTKPSQLLQIWTLDTGCTIDGLSRSKLRIRIIWLTLWFEFKNFNPLLQYNYKSLWSTLGSDANHLDTLWKYSWSKVIKMAHFDPLLDLKETLKCTFLRIQRIK